MSQATLLVADDTLARRRAAMTAKGAAAWKPAAPRARVISAALRAYAQAYLESHPQISKAPGMTLMVRVQEPTALGIPLQLYCFSAVTAWVDYEGIQGQVLDHLIGMLPQFGLALYQRSSDLGSRFDVKTDNPAP